jgi:hypothetical protein
MDVFAPPLVDAVVVSFDHGELGERAVLVAVVSAVINVLGVVVVYFSIKSSRRFCCHSSSF